MHYCKAKARASALVAGLAFLSTSLSAAATPAFGETSAAAGGKAPMASILSGTGATCGAHHNQLCPSGFMPSNYNDAQILKQLITETDRRVGPVSKLLRNEVHGNTTWRGPTTPAPVPKKSYNVALVACSTELQGCVTPLTAMQKIAHAIGWKATLYNGQGEGSVMSQDIATAVGAGANVIVYSGHNPGTLQHGLQLAAQKHIPVISVSAGDDSPNPKILPAPGQAWFQVGISPNFVLSGWAMADWAIQNSGGKGDIAVITTKESANNISQAAAVAEIDKFCPGCKIYTYSLYGADVATTWPTNTVSFFRAHPQVKYMIAPYDPAVTTAVPALQQAGITDIKICSLLGDAENLNYIRKGELQTCDESWDNAYMGWAAFDQLLRTLDHEPYFVPHDENMPQLLITTQNVPKGAFRTPFNYEAKYAKLWGVPLTKLMG